MKQSSYNIQSEQFAALRAEAEAEAQSILKERNAGKRALAETEALTILKERKNFQQKKKEHKTPNVAKAKKERPKAQPKVKKDQITDSDAEVRARKAEAALKQLQKEVEEKANRSKKRKFINGFIGIIIIIISFSWISSSIKSCMEEREAEEFLSTYPTEGEIDPETDDEISSTDYSNVKSMLKKRFDDVSEYDHYLEIKKGGKYGIADLNGNIKIEPKYDYIGLPDEELGIVEVKKGEKYGLVSLKTLEEIIEPKYEFIGTVSEESKTIEVRINDKYGLLSSVDLTEILEPTFDFIGSYKEETGLFEVKKNGKYGLFSPSKKKVVTPCIFDFISYDGVLYQVRKDHKSGRLNADGSMLKPLQ